MCPHISLNLLCSSVPLLPLPIVLLMLSSTVVLLPFPHALLALLQGRAAKPLAAVRGQGWGWGPERRCQEGFRPLWPLSLWMERGFLCLILSGQGDKQKEEAELSKELDRGDVFCRKGCMSNREQTLLEGVFNIWLAQSHSLEVYSYFVTFSGLHFHICPNMCIYLFIPFCISVQPLFLPFPSAWSIGCFSSTSVPKIP